MKRIIAVCIGLLLCSCAGRAPLPDDRAEENRAWSDMQKASAEAAGPYRIQLSMRFGEEGNTRRVTGILWGNGEDAIRLDVMAGVGATIARVAEAGDNFLVLAPSEKRAYYHSGPTRPLLKIGVPAPFDLLQLANILTGRFAEVFGASYEAAGTLPNGNPAYELTSPVPGRLELNGAGEPVAWRQDDGGWKMELAYDDDAPYLPKSARFTNRNGKMAIILVKERENVAAPFDAGQLELKLPADIVKLPLSQYKAS